MYTSLSSELDCTCTGLYCTYVYISFGYLLRRVKSVCSFSLRRYCLAFCQSRDTNLHSLQQYMRHPAALYSQLVGSGFCLFCSVLFVLSHATG